MHQVSFNQSHDLDPAVLPDGRVVFSRWDNAPGHDEISLYTMRPDGSDLQLLYGARSHDTGTNGEDVHFLDPRPTASGKLLVLRAALRGAGPRRPAARGGHRELRRDHAADAAEPRRAAGPAQVAATSNDVRTIDGPSPGGRYNSAFPVAGRHRPAAADLEPVPPAGARHGSPPRTDRAVHARPAGGRHGGDGRAALWRVDLRPGAADTAAGCDARWKARSMQRRRRTAAASLAASAARSRRRRRLRCRARGRGRRHHRHSQRL